MANLGNRFLNRVDRIGNGLPHPATLFLCLSMLILILSWIGASAGWQAVHPGTGAVVVTENLLSREGWHMILERMVRNLTDFAPMGIVLVAVMGVGVAEDSGLIGAFTRLLVIKSPKKILTFVVVFTGIMSNIASDVGHVLLVPLAGAIYLALGRHPIIGMAAAFAGVSGGFSANLLIGTIDPLLAAISTESANIVDPTYYVTPMANYYFMAVSAVLISFVGTFVTEKVVAPRFQNYDKPEDIHLEEVKSLSKLEKKGIGVSLIVFFVLTAVLLALALPKNAPLRAMDGSLLKSPIIRGVVSLLFIFAAIMGIAYGIVTKRYKKDAQVYRAMTESVKQVADFVVLVFFAAQFVKYFEWSNLGVILAINGVSFFESLDMHIIPLMILFILFAAFINLFIGSASAKWVILGPIFIPMFMFMGYSPELSQAVFRIGDSCTNIITPMMSFFPLILTYFQKYDKKAGMGTVISAMLPYTVAFFIAWTALLIVWILLEIPLGPGAGLFYQP